MTLRTRSWAAFIRISMGLTLSGCIINYQPHRVAPHELVLQQQTWGYEVRSGDKDFFTSARHSYWALGRYVHCEEEAYRHAKLATRNQLANYFLMSIASSFAVTGSVLYATNPLGLSRGDITKIEPDLTYFYLLGSGIFAAGFGIAAFASKNSADGHLLDAVNYYNDRVGSLGAGCDGTPYAKPELVPPPPGLGPTPSLTSPANLTLPAPPPAVDIKKHGQEGP